jgi:hypothetical protein
MVTTKILTHRCAATVKSGSVSLVKLSALRAGMLQRNRSTEGKSGNKMSNEIGMQIRSTPTCVLYLDTLPLTTPAELAEHLWATIGINLDPETRIAIKGGSALILIDRNCAADFIQRCLENAGEKIRCKPAKSMAARSVTQKKRSQCGSTIGDMVLSKA